MTLNGKQRGYSLMELMVGLMLVGMALALLVPSGQGTKDAATTKTTAEELVARFRQARQTAITKSVPVAVAFPIAANIFHTDQAFFLEGEVNPRVTEQWKIQQPYKETVYFTGTWNGPDWDDAPVMETASKNFDPDTWFGPADPPQANMYIFTPSGNMVSKCQAADGKYRVLVGMGVSSSGGGLLTTASVPYTVWISPSGEVGMDKGVYGGEVVASYSKDSSPVATFTAAARPANRAPQITIVPGMSVPGAKAYPDNVNPKTENGNIISLDSVLTLEIRVKDLDGDPPYFRWKTTEAAEVSEDGNSFTDLVDMDKWGGRFSNNGEVRMEWDAERQEWVGRDTWAPATGDTGGNRYKLECTIRDRNGGQITSGFPVDGHYLVTSKEPWILYRSWNAQGRAELWKMTLDGLDHTRVVSFGYQDVEYAQWAPSGAEIIVGANDGVWRVSSDGGNLKKVGNGLPGSMDGCCISPSGDAVYYAGGNSNGKIIRKVYIDGSGRTKDVALATDNESPGLAGGPNVFEKVETVYDLSAAQFGSKVVLLCTYYHYNKSGGFLGTGLFSKKKKRWGTMAIDANTGDHTSYDEPPSWNKIAQDKKTNYGISFATTNDPAALDGVHVLYGSSGGVIYSRNVTISGGAMNGGFLNSSNVAGFPLATGRADVHHPRYATPDHNSMVFVSGRGTASRIYYMPNIASPGSNYALPLSPFNNGADLPSVSRPRYRWET
jgi:prepilin-type N-terminal cleavage/methylation domain-containing protein